MKKSLYPNLIGEPPKIWIVWFQNRKTSASKIRQITDNTLSMSTVRSGNFHSFQFESFKCSRKSHLAAKAGQLARSVMLVDSVEQIRESILKNLKEKKKKKRNQSLRIGLLDFFSTVQPSFRSWTGKTPHCYWPMEAFGLTWRFAQ